MDADVLIVGAGPAGLSLAISLVQAEFRVTVIEQQPATALAQPAPDGREIALTHPSVDTLRRLGTWQHLAEHERGLIREAIVHDGPVGWRPTLDISPAGSGLDALGHIVPNHALRRTAWTVAAELAAAPDARLRLLTGWRVTAVQITPEQVELTATAASPDSGEGTLTAPVQLRAPLIVAADSRFSAMRRLLGVGAQMLDFGRTVIVCRLRHTEPHDGRAHECFGWARTLAILPLPDDPASGSPCCSAVVTTDSADAARLLALSPEAFAAQVQADAQDRLGTMHLEGERHAYPLVAAYAHRFSGERYALLGDAAVGMHPVTAHGFNLGLAGVERLTQAIVRAHAAGQDWGQASALAPYARAHHRHAWPIYQGTNAVVRLFTDARATPRVLRQLVLQGARHLPPLRAAIAAQLTGRSLWPLLAANLVPRPRAG